MRRTPCRRRARRRRVRLARVQQHRAARVVVMRRAQRRAAAPARSTSSRDAVGHAERHGLAPLAADAGLGGQREALAQRLGLARCARGAAAPRPRRAGRACRSRAPRLITSGQESGPSPAPSTVARMCCVRVRLRGPPVLARARHAWVRLSDSASGSDCSRTCRIRAYGERRRSTNRPRGTSRQPPGEVLHGGVELLLQLRGLLERHLLQQRPVEELARALAARPLEAREHLREARELGCVVPCSCRRSCQLSSPSTVSSWLREAPEVVHALGAHRAARRRARPGRRPARRPRRARATRSPAAAPRPACRCRGRGRSRRAGAALPAARAAGGSNAATALARGEARVPRQAVRRGDLSPPAAPRPQARCGRLHSRTVRNERLDGAAARSRSRPAGCARSAARAAARGARPPRPARR